MGTGLFFFNLKPCSRILALKYYLYCTSRKNIAYIVYIDTTSTTKRNLYSGDAGSNLGVLSTLRHRFYFLLQQDPVFRLITASFDEL